MTLALVHESFLHRYTREIGCYGLSNLDLHQLLPGVVEPYWCVVRENKRTPMFEVYQRGPFVVRIGSLTSFEERDLAEIVEYGYQSYLRQEAFGNFLTEASDKDEEALHARMVSGFNRNQTFISVMDGRSGVVVGGAIVNPSFHDRLVIDGIGKKDCGLPTFYSLTFNAGEWGTLNENNTVCYSRFWRLPYEQLNAVVGFSYELTKYNAHLIREIMSQLPRASLILQQSLGREYHAGWIDTTDKGVRDMAVRYYGATIVDEQPTETDHVAQSPLHWHFRMPSVVGVFLPEKQIPLAQSVDNALGKKEPVFWAT